MHLDELTGRRVVLLGLGADVLAAVPQVLAAGPAEVLVVDDGRAAMPPDLAARGVAVANLADGSAAAEVFVRSPGFPRYQPELAVALDRGAKMTTPIDLWWGTHGLGRTVVGITGTKGKSTVTELVGSLADRAGLRVGVAGNVGVPVFDPGWDHDAPVIVLEVSSYQAADLHHVPDLAVLTYLSEDHLSWHGGVERYIADKLRLLRNESGTARRILVPATGGRVDEVLAELGMVAEVVTPPAGPVSVPAHRLQNAALAAAVLAALGGPKLRDADVVEAAGSSLPGRLDACPGPAGLLCLDDALASNPSAAAAGLGWVRSLDRPTVVLLGGSDRGVDPAPLAHEVSRWAPGLLRAVAVPDSGAALAARVGVDVLAVAEDVSEAVAVALGALPTDGIVLFSPGAPTPAAIGTWKTRSDQFRAALLG